MSAVAESFGISAMTSQASWSENAWTPSAVASPPSSAPASAPSSPAKPRPMSAPILEPTSTASSCVRLLRCSTSMSPSASLYTASASITLTVSDSRSRSSSAMTSPWKSGDLKPRTTSCTGPTAMRFPSSSVVLEVFPGRGGGASSRRGDRPVVGVAAGVQTRDEERDDRHQVELPDERLDDRERACGRVRGREVAVPERRQRDVAEVQAHRARAVGSLREERGRRGRERPVDEREEQPEQDIDRDRAAHRLEVHLALVDDPARDHGGRRYDQHSLEQPDRGGHVPSRDEVQASEDRREGDERHAGPGAPRDRT